MSSLYEIKNNYRGLLEMDLDEQALADTLESIEGDFQDKAENICQVLINMDADIVALDNEIKRLQDRKKSFKARQDSLKEYLRSNMEGIGKKSVKTALFSITRTKGRQVCSIVDEELIADKFKKISTVTSIDKALLLSELKAGETVLGAEITIGKEGLRFK